jgi:hypothetical protein
VDALVGQVGGHQAPFRVEFHSLQRKFRAVQIRLHSA